MQPIAIYDLDRTVLRQPTFTPFLAFAARRIAPWRLALMPVWVAMMAGYRAGLYDRTTLKRRGMRLMLGNPTLKRLEDVGREYARHRVETSGFMPGTMRLIEEDRAKGARILIATAAFDFYARAVAEIAGIDTVIATRWDGAAIPGGNCYGETKLARVREWAAGEGISLETADLRFVSDSFADAPLLNIADEAIFVTDNQRQAERAAARGWDARDLSA